MYGMSELYDKSFSPHTMTACDMTACVSGSVGGSVGGSVESVSSSV